GLSKSFDTTKTLLASTADYCIQDARALAHGPDGFLYTYDNANFSTSIFVEQRSSAPAKVQSGTYTIIYRLRNPNPAALDLPFILLRAQNTSDLDFNHDLCPTRDQSSSSHHQFCSYVIRTLCRYEKSFQSRQDDPDLMSQPRRPLPAGYKAPQFPIKLCTVEESSIKGNLAVHVENLIKQLGLTYEQLTKAIFQLGIGLFHLCLNFSWAVLNVHRGHVNHHGTLAHLFAIIDKTQLGSNHPDYHTLLSVLMQILDGLLLDAWRIECGHRNLAEFAASNPTASQLRKTAAKILYNHGT
ncbi:hypothetical protein B0H11DRAFT_1662642, partial [Mycena galericulata]